MFIHIRAKDGYVLTDGTNYAETFDLAENVDITKYHEITREEYNNIIDNENRGVINENLH